MLPQFDARLFQQLARAHALRLGQPLCAVAVTGSTNDDAGAAARAGAPHGALFMAQQQTDGRGRRGRHWTSPPGASLLFSLVLRPDLRPDRAQALTLALGLGLRDAAAEQVSVPVGLKWPNDVVANGRKLAGILVETQLQGCRVQAVVAGIGLNVSQREFSAELGASATSLALLGAPELGREQLLVQVLAAIQVRLQDYLRSELATMLPELRQHDVLRGRRVCANSLAGIACGIDPSGALLLEDDAGQLHRVTSGSIELG
jgi:BirA family biotin operon repressor/biotin-[acetyl-CoA-carboxylase] ligase